MRTVTEGSAQCLGPVKNPCMVIETMQTAKDHQPPSNRATKSPAKLSFMKKQQNFYIFKILLTILTDKHLFLPFNRIKIIISHTISTR